jgi:hypothetical protein
MTDKHSRTPDRYARALGRAMAGPRPARSAALPDEGAQ